MNIYTKKGEKVEYMGVNGYDSDLKHANQFLKRTQTYTVLETIVDAWHTDVILEEFPEEKFKSVHFKNCNG